MAGSSVPLNRTRSPVLKRLPPGAALTARLKVGAPAVIDVGLRVLRVGGGKIGKIAGAELTPSDETTVMLTNEGAATSEAGTLILSLVELTWVVVRLTPFHSTVPPLRFVPITARVKPALPAVRYAGLKLVIVGPATMLNGDGSDVDPPGFVTVTLTVLGGAMTILAGTTAVSWFVLTKVVGSAFPSKLITDVIGRQGPSSHPRFGFETKFAPFTVSVNVDRPAVAALGTKLVITGRLTVNVAAFDRLGEPDLLLGLSQSQ